MLVEDRMVIEIQGVV